MKQLLEIIGLAAREGFSCSFSVWQHSHNAEPYIASLSVHRHTEMLACVYRTMTAKQAARLIARLTDFPC